MVAYFPKTEKKDSEKFTAWCLEWSQGLNCQQKCLSHYMVRIELLSEYLVMTLLQNVVGTDSIYGWFR